MLYSPAELTKRLGDRIRLRRARLGLTQVEAAGRSGVSYRTWRRLERDGQASIDDLIRAALALRCETEVESLFPDLPARSMDELLARQRRNAQVHDRSANIGRSTKR